MSIQGPTSALSSFLRISLLIDESGYSKCFCLGEFGIQARGHRFQRAQRNEDGADSILPAQLDDISQGELVTLSVQPRPNARARLLGSSARTSKKLAKKVKLDDRRCIRCEDKDAEPCVSLCSSCLSLSTLVSAGGSNRRGKQKTRTKNVREKLLEDSFEQKVVSLQDLCVKVYLLYCFFLILKCASRLCFNTLTMWNVLGRCRIPHAINSAASFANTED